MLGKVAPLKVSCLRALVLFEACIASFPHTGLAGKYGTSAVAAYRAPGITVCARSIDLLQLYYSTNHRVVTGAQCAIRRDVITCSDVS